ncbi:MAG: pilin [Patescibacteria group bacterium]
MNLFLKNLILVQSALAQSGFGQQPPSQSGVGQQPPSQTGIGGQIIPSKSLEQILNDLIGFAVGLGLTIATLMIIWGGYQILFAKGDPTEFENGKRTITYAVIGVAVLLISRALIALIKEIIGA